MSHHPSCLFVSKAGTLLARAQPLVKSDSGDADVSNARQWQLFDNEIQLTIRKRAEDKQWHLRPELSLEGKVGYPVSLSFPLQITNVCMHVIWSLVLLLVISIKILANVHSMPGVR